MFASLRDRRSLEAAAPGRPGDGPCGGALQNMLLSRRDEIAVTMPRRRPNTPNSQNIFSLSDILPPFFPLCAAVCSQLFISPPSPSLCARVSNELVWFPFFLPQAYFSSHLHHPPVPPPLPHPLSCFLLSMPPLSPKDCPGCFFSLLICIHYFIHIYLYIYMYSHGTGEPNTHRLLCRSCSCSARVVLICLKGVKNA